MINDLKTRFSIKPLRRTVTALCAGVLIGMSSGAVFAQDRVGDFALLDHEDIYHNMSWHDNNKAIALFVQVNGDAASQASLDELSALRAAYESQGIVFMMINPLGESRDSVTSAASQFDGVPVLIDDTQLISDALGIQKSGEVLLFNPYSFRVMYRGAADGQFRSALDAAVSGTLTQAIELSVAGTNIAYPVRDLNMAAGVSYSRDVAPVLVKHRADCHRKGGIAPFALNSHAIAQGWSPMIREVLMTKRMPPA